MDTTMNKVVAGIQGYEFPPREPASAARNPKLTAFLNRAVAMVVAMYVRNDVIQ